MYIRNNNGPKMFPCRTPKVTRRASDNLFSPEVSAVSDYSSTKKTTAKTRGETPTADNLDIIDETGPGCTVGAGN